MPEVIQTFDLKKTYPLEEPVHALRGVNLTIGPGEFVSIMGASGSGKSTFMNILGCLDRPTSGSYELDGVKVGGLSRNELADIRNEKIGFVFQGFNLLSRTSALENVELPLVYQRKKSKIKPKDKAMDCLVRVGLADRMGHQTQQLSGGQQQRVAIARSLVNDPALILADEPTGNLDSRTSLDLMGLFQELNQQGITIVLVTHEPDIAMFTKRCVEMRDGLIVRDTPIEEQRDAKLELEEFSGVIGI
ncbi:MAG: ABC transporter ATP-binding protein [Opitutales bacterium]|jgi:putative ABC transport system ATP-binding protein|nr:ABC transporter ATP-binding protein [Opitutales bacterium]MBT5170130.1 ABC transporter ATP-binding protein [Opitutales bacterium]MBT5815707.1 ABC transporter ATP-binding protein [Opitutales bacterium]MBT6381394.1 ABC transporter ATP-binding protein [Opitutales bacterium]